MKTISIITQKGGVGKTTSSIHIGGSLALSGYRILLIDFDTQKNLSLGLNVPSDWDYTVEDFLLSDKKPKFLQKGKNDKISVLAGSNALIEKKLRNNSLKKALARVENQFDYVIIDCPPKPINVELSFGEIAVFASDFVISPVKADKYSIAGTGSFMSAINGLKQNYGIKTHILGFFFNEVEENTNHFNTFYNLILNSPAGDFLLRNYIRKDVLVKNAMDEGKTVFEIKPFGRASRDFDNLTDEILEKIKEHEKQN